MDEPKTRFDKFNLRIKNNPIMASLIILGTIVIALSTFTDAAKNLLGLINNETRTDINGEWIADVTYDWNNAIYVETFTFNGEGEEVYGTASYLKLGRGIMEGRVKDDKLQFITKTQEVIGNENERKDVVHRYVGKIVGDEIIFVMQTEGGFSTHVPIEFTVKRVVSSSFESKE